MRKRTRAILMLAVITLSGVAGAQTQRNHPATKKTGVNPAIVSQPVTGAGTPGQITKWTGAGPINYAVGESIITEDKFANIGVGTTSPTSKFTVAGTIETTTGGVKFPDGSTQTTAGISSVVHDATLMGNGTGALPLGIASGGVGPLQLKTPTAPVAGQMLGFDGAALQWVTPLAPPSQQPFQAEFGVDDSGAAQLFIQVPANKRLVIEVVSLYATLVLDGNYPKFLVPYVTTSVNSREVRHYLATGTPRDDRPGSPNVLHYSISQSTRLYADPGTRVRLSQYGTLGSISSGSISGYLLDAVP